MTAEEIAESIAFYHTRKKSVTTDGADLIKQYALQVAEKAVGEEKSAHSTGSPRGPVTMANMILTRIKTLTETGGE